MADETVITDPAFLETLVGRLGLRLSARVVVLTREGESSYDTGGFTVNYSAGRRHGSSYVELGMVSREGKLRT